MLILFAGQARKLDLRRQSDTERFFEEESSEYVYLAAAKVGGILPKFNQLREL